MSANVPHSIRLQEELRSAKDELSRVVKQIKSLESMKRGLMEKVSSIKSQLDILSATGSGHRSEFDTDNYSWSEMAMSKLKSVFKIDQFRSYQRVAINATMSNLDCLLVMPTGGGKSLCFQLPSILGSGVTLVVSPLISLMEDQLQGMNQLGIPTMIFNSTTDRERTKYIFDSMVDNNSKLKLLYVTPEKLAKSKRLMSQLEKMYRMGRFARLVIDEVHCCSEWGHDFRPDFKFLGIMKTQYPKTPIIGLTATATPNVIIDVQKILNIEGCLVFKDSFFRPNLKYEVWDCESETSKIDDLVLLINNRFKNESGIVYCLTVKDCEEVSKELRRNRIKAERYHAQLDSNERTRIQREWYDGEKCHVICATIAFGMGINKLNVRFVIHYSLSKSVENYYQETGRAGRDGEPAHCILLYKLADTFRASVITIVEKNGLSNVYNMLKYALDRKNCRKMLLAQHFADEWELSGCGEMCDNCVRKGSEDECRKKFVTMDAGPLLDDIEKILDHAVAQNAEERMTLLKLMDAWMGKGSKNLRVESVPVPKYNRQTCETIVALLLLDEYLKEEFHFTPYTTISHIVLGAKVVMRANGQLSKSIPYELPESFVKTSSGKARRRDMASSSSSSQKSKASVNSLSSSQNVPSNTSMGPPSSMPPPINSFSSSSCGSNNSPVSIQTFSTNPIQKDTSPSINSFSSDSTVCPRSLSLSVNQFSTDSVRKSPSPTPIINSFSSSSDNDYPKSSSSIPDSRITNYSSSCSSEHEHENPSVSSFLSSTKSLKKTPSLPTHPRSSSSSKKKKTDSRKSTHRDSGPESKKSKSNDFTFRRRPNRSDATDSALSSLKGSAPNTPVIDID